MFHKIKREEFELHRIGKLSFQLIDMPNKICTFFVLNKFSIENLENILNVAKEHLLSLK